MHSHAILHESTCMAVSLQWSGMQPELMNSIRPKLALHGAQPGASVASAFLICNSSPVVYLQINFVWCCMCRCISENVIGQKISLKALRAKLIERASVAQGDCV